MESTPGVASNAPSFELELPTTVLIPRTAIRPVTTNSFFINNLPLKF